MPIIELQRRLREVGRIRLGEQVATGNGRKRPAKLTKFRLTSRDDQVLTAAAELWGGEVRSWDNGGNPEFELYTDANQVPVVVPPTEMAFSQWYEQWSAGGCQVRCDGAWDNQGDKACHCDPENRACKITTRLSVILPDLPGLGVWRVESHGYYAAVELNGAVEVCQQFAGQGRMLPARLRLDQRTVVRDGKTNRFAVPVLDVDVQIGQLVALGSGGAAGALPAATAPTFQPVPPELDPGAPSLADQLDAIDTPGESNRRGRAPLPGTGVAPRTAAEASALPADGPTCADCGGSLAGALVRVKPGGVKTHRDGCPDAGGGPAADPDDEVVDAEVVDEDPPGEQAKSDKPDAQRWREAIIIKAKEAGVDHHHVVAAVTDGRTSSSKDLTRDEAFSVLDALDSIQLGDLLLEVDGDTARLVANDPPDGGRDPDPAEPVDGDEPVEWDGDRWRQHCAEHGVKPVPALKEARRFAEAEGHPLPSSIDAVAGPVATHLRAWIAGGGA